jgi:Fe-S-cluster containining protein
MSICESHGCTRCCIGQTKPLLNEDVDRIVATGHYDSYFSKQINGWLVLQNLDGHCVFYKNGRCEIYSRRPLACQLAPYVYDDETGQVVVDPTCAFGRDFVNEPQKIAAVRATAQKLIAEREKRLRVSHF